MTTLWFPAPGFPPLWRAIPALPSALALAVIVCALATPARAFDHPLDEPAETPIVVPPPVPVGFLVAWRPMVLSVRADSGGGSRFGSDKLALLRGLVRYTFLFKDTMPFVGRFELEGGEFKTDTQGTNLGSVGADVTARALVGAATRISSGFTVLASAGLITRYQHGNVVGGAPDIGAFGAGSNMELEIRLFPVITLSLFAEAALAPFPYAAQDNLGDLSDASEFRARIQLSFDLTQRTAIDVGYDFTRWHASFTGSTLLGNPRPDQALLLEDREHAITIGFRFK